MPARTFNVLLSSTEQGEQRCLYAYGADATVGQGPVHTMSANFRAGEHGVQSLHAWRTRRGWSMTPLVETSHLGSIGEGRDALARCVSQAKEVDPANAPDLNQ